MNLKQLAQKLGLSQTTVSRALNGYPEVSEATRLRVQQAAAQHSYRPNTRAKSLATGRAMTIGHVIPVSSQHEIVNPVFGDFIAGAGETYARNGYDMTLSLVNDADEAQVYRTLKSEGSVDGIIVHGPRRADPRIALLEKIGLPFVVHGRASDVNTPYAWVDMDNFRAFRRATEFLLDLGHRRIALVNGLEGLDFAFRRRSGYVAALAARGIDADPALMRSEEMTEVYGFDTARDMLDLPQPPSAFLVSSMIVAIGVRRAVQDRGLRPGREVSIFTHDDDLSYLRNGRDAPIFSATRSSVRQAGRVCADMLIARIRDPAAPFGSTLLEAELMVGQTTGPGPCPGGPRPEG